VRTPDHRRRLRASSSFARDINARGLAGLPVTRKSELLELQKRAGRSGIRGGALGERSACSLAGSLYTEGHADYCGSHGVFAADSPRDLVQTAFPTISPPIDDETAHALGCTYSGGPVRPTAVQRWRVKPTATSAPSFLKIILDKADRPAGADEPQEGAVSVKPSVEPARRAERAWDRAYKRTRRRTSARSL